MYTHIHTTNTHTLEKRASHARMTKVVVKDYSIKPSSLPLGICGRVEEGRWEEIVFSIATDLQLRFQKKSDPRYLC